MALDQYGRDERGLVWREDLGRWDAPDDALAQRMRWDQVTSSSLPQGTEGARTANIAIPNSGFGRHTTPITTYGVPQGLGNLSDADIQRALMTGTLDRSAVQQGFQSLYPNLPAGFYGSSPTEFDFLAGLDPLQQDWGLGSSAYYGNMPRGSFMDQFMEWATPVAAIAGPMVAGHLLGLGGSGAGAAGGALPTAASTAADLAWLEGVAPFGAETFGLGGAGSLATGATGAAGDIFGQPSWLANNWLADMGPVASQAGATFNSSMPWYAQLAEAQTLGGSGLTAAEMGTLGVSPWAAQIGAQTWLPSLTGPGQNTGSTALNALTRIPTSALNGQLGGGLPGVTSGGAGGPEFTPAPSNLQPMWGGQPNYQQFEDVSFAGTAPTLLQRLGRIRNG